MKDIKEFRDELLDYLLQHKNEYKNVTNIINKYCLNDSFDTENIKKRQDINRILYELREKDWIKFTNGVSCGYRTNIQSGKPEFINNEPVEAILTLNGEIEYSKLRVNSNLSNPNNKDLEFNNKIFISHSSNDIVFVKSFVENILQIGLNIPSERIFCSSLEGNGVKSGQYIPDRLKEEINKSSLALLFISKNYRLSEICLNEVGAAWAVLKKESVIPMLLPNIDFSEIGFLDLNRLGLKIYERAGILKLIEDCKEQLNARFKIEKLDKKIDDYLSVYS